MTERISDGARARLALFRALLRGAAQTLYKASNEYDDSDVRCIEYRAVADKLIQELK